MGNISAILGMLAIVIVIILYCYTVYHLVLHDDIKKILITWYKVEHYVEMGSCQNDMHWVQCLDKGKPNRFDTPELAQEFLDFHLDRFKSGQTIYRIVKVTEEVIY